MTKSDAQREHEREIYESILRGMATGDLPLVHCPVCDHPIEYVSVLREAGRIVSLRTDCPCHYSQNAIRGI